MKLVEIKKWVLHNNLERVYIKDTTCPFSNNNCDCGDWCPFFEYAPDFHQIILRCTGTEVVLRIKDAKA